MKAKEEASSVNHVMTIEDTPEDQDRDLQDVQDHHLDTMTTGTKSIEFRLLLRLSSDKQIHAKNTAGERRLLEIRTKCSFYQLKILTNKSCLYLLKLQ